MENITYNQIIFECCYFELFLFSLQLVLLVYELLAQDALFVVEVEEDGEILGQLVVLLSFDYSFDFTLFRDFLTDLVNSRELNFLGFLQEALLLFTVDLSFDVLLLPLLLAKQ